MKIRKILIIILLPVVIYSQNISKEQNNKNKAFLNNLDENVTETIDMLVTFNKTAKKIEVDITGWNTYSKFLLELTMECSNIKKIITSSDTLTFEERELTIRNLMSSLYPNTKYLPYPIGAEQDKQHSELLEIFRKKLGSKQEKLIKLILIEENKIVESGTFNKYYLSLHTENYIYSLLRDFIDQQEKLSPKNRKYLLSITRDIEDKFNDSN